MKNPSKKSVSIKHYAKTNVNNKSDKQEYFYKNVLVITDNELMCEMYFKICSELNIPLGMFSVAHSDSNAQFNVALPPSIPIFSLNLKTDSDIIIGKYDLIFSIHCKQIFPNELINRIKCINIHPGLNPYNRGWFPQVFSIINKLPLGATIHEIDELLDHGPIIAQKEVKLVCTDDSLSAYLKVQEAEIELIKENILDILLGNYTTCTPDEEGNVNFKRDFSALCRLDLKKKTTIGETINLLRALTHGTFKNGFFINPENNKKVYIKITLEEESD